MKRNVLVLEKEIGLEVAACAFCAEEDELSLITASLHPFAGLTTKRALGHDDFASDLHVTLWT